MICVDASLAVKWILDEDLSDRAQALLEVTMAAGEVIVAPPLLPMEVTNVLRQQQRKANGLAPIAATGLLRQFLRIPVNLVSVEAFHERALALAEMLQLPAVYDAYYLALSEHLDCELWTADRRLLRVVSSRLQFVRALEEFG